MVWMLAASKKLPSRLSLWPTLRGQCAGRADPWKTGTVADSRRDRDIPFHYLVEVIRVYRVAEVHGTGQDAAAGFFARAVDDQDLGAKAGLAPAELKKRCTQKIFATAGASRTGLFQAFSQEAQARLRDRAVPRPAGSAGVDRGTACRPASGSARPRLRTQVAAGKRSGDIVGSGAKGRRNRPLPRFLPRPN